MVHPRSHEAPGLFDERSNPDFRTIFGRLLSGSTHVDVALRRIRLSTLDLETAELENLRRLRVLVAEVNAVTLGVEAHGVLLEPRRGQTLRHLAYLLDREVVQVRAAPLGGWSPDYTVFRGPDGPRAVLLGFHWLERPFPHRGPALASLHGPAGAMLAGRRFDESWGRAHDIRPAMQGILRRAQSQAEGMPTDSPKPQRAQGISVNPSPSTRVDTSPGSD